MENTESKPFEIEELDDQSLEDVAGGVADNAGCSNTGCGGSTNSGGCTNNSCGIKPVEIEQ